MKEIHLLRQETIDQIAAGEVIERPASVVKELVENAIDAGANAVTVEIREGGLSLIRITDNGEGIEKSQIRSAFLRHATSKITSVEDLLHLGSLGFRGEALSSISAVSQVELITKTPDDLTGVRYCIEGGQEVSYEEIGAPEGSTFLVRNLFYNTPARKKFLKSAATEAGYISDLMTHLALSRPGISFQLIQGGQVKLHTSGNGSLKDIIYHVYGRDYASNLIEIDEERGGITLQGFIGKPSLSRGNRSFENYYVNHRYVKSSVMTRAIEEGYKTFLMQHRYPFTVLKLQIDADLLDVNVHPTKMDVRFANNQVVFDLICDAVRHALSHRELIPQVSPQSEREIRQEARRGQEIRPARPEPFEQVRRDLLAQSQSPYQPKYTHLTGQRETVPDLAAQARARQEAQANQSGLFRPERDGTFQETVQVQGAQAVQRDEPVQNARTLQDDALAQTGQTADDGMLQCTSQMVLPLLSEESRPQHRLIGQVFDTYWIVQYRDQLYLIDQHAAHEKVMFERLTARLKNRQVVSQMISPPMILSLSMQEEQLLQKYDALFREAGFVIEPFGGREYAITAAPDEFCSIPDMTLFTDMLDGLQEDGGKAMSEVLYIRLATMACKSAVKGNTRLSTQEADALISELLTLDNPYHCPHGRPTIISMSKYELEKKFKRIV